MSVGGWAHSLKVAIGEKTYEQAHERDAASAQNPLLRRSLWRFRLPATRASFITYFTSQSSREAQFPLINALLRRENRFFFKGFKFGRFFFVTNLKIHRLVQVKHIVDLLAWQRVVYSVFPSGGSLSRDRARDITNAQLVEMMPSHDQPRALRVLKAYCVAFNAAFCHVERIECQPNPFLRNGEVDLGTGSGMSEETSIVCLTFIIILILFCFFRWIQILLIVCILQLFSLPSTTPGTIDVGMCIVTLFNFLQNCHNDLFGCVCALYCKL